MIISDSNAHEPIPSFSDAALQRLSVAITHQLTRKPVDPNGGLPAAAEQLCVEAHAKQLRAEHIVLAVHGIWATNATSQALDPKRTSMAYQHVLDVCLDAYFRE